MRLLSFGVSNFRSFNREQVVTFGQDDKNTTAFLGANGSGKTNFYLALFVFRQFILTSAQYDSSKLSFEPFLFNVKNMNLPVSMNVQLQIDNDIYKYYFSLDHRNRKILQEKLAHKNNSPDSKYETIFSRPSIANGKYGEFYNEMRKITRDDTLILTKSWENNDIHAKRIFSWLKNFQLINGTFGLLSNYTAQNIYQNQELKHMILDLLKQADLHIQNFNIKKARIPQQMLDQLPFNPEFKQSIKDGSSFLITTDHVLRDENGDFKDYITLSMQDHESAGTNRIFELSYIFLQILEKGGVLYIDSFENDLHEKECEFLVKLFAQRNPKHSQLIINTHNTSLLNWLGRDNIKIVGKNGCEESIIRDVPNSIRLDDKALERKFRKGFFGGIPNIAVKGDL